MRLEVHPFSTDAEARTWGKDQIDASAGQARSRYLTVSPGQEATYTAKYADAKAFFEAGDNPDMSMHPWIKQEADRTGMTFQAAANRIKQLGDYWQFVVGPDIEGKRMGGKDSLDRINGIPQIVAAVRLSQQELDQI